jgi:PAS domain S-box-containing protein
MSWVTIIWAMIASACLTLAMVHLVVWFKQTGQRAPLLFSVTAISVAAIAACELLLMRAQTAEQFGTVLRWAHLPVFFAVVSIVGFVWLYFRAGRPWLAYTVCGLRLLALIINFLSVPNLNYKQITGLRHLTTLGGETISVAEGIPNPWTKLAELSSLLLLIFVVDASVTLWRRGNRTERRRALVVGGSITFCISVAAGNSALLHAGLIDKPYLISFPFLAIVAAMGYELSSDMVRAALLTRQLQASEAALRESEARFRILADTAPVMVWMSGTDMLCNFFNKQWLEFTGRALEQELGNGWSEGVHAEDIQRCLQTYVSSFNVRRPFTMEYRLRGDDGEYRWVLDNGVPRYTPEGRFAGYIGSCIDITERTRAEEALRESEQRMALATHAANLGIWVRDLVRDEIWATDKWRELFGFEKSERLDVHRILQRLHPKDREAVSKVFAKALGGEGSYEVEYRVVLPDGRVRWITSRGRVEFDATGKPVLVRGVSLDNTARKLAEEAAHDLSGRLIQAQEEAQMRLARDLHDDLSQSLALLSVELEMFGQSPPSEGGQISAQIQEFSGQVKRLSADVHRISHELHPAKLEQLGLVAAVRGFCKEFAVAHEIAIEIVDRSVPRTVPEATALCLYRIVQEALHNVVKHSGGTVARVELAMDGGELRLAVADDGVGFDPERMRANGSLGLVSMHERARFVHGLLSVESHAGKGTKVEVRVPIAAADHLS